MLARTFLARWRKRRYPAAKHRSPGSGAGSLLVSKVWSFLARAEGLRAQTQAEPAKLQRTNGPRDEYGIQLNQAWMNLLDCLSRH